MVRLSDSARGWARFVDDSAGVDTRSEEHLLFVQVLRSTGNIFSSKQVCCVRGWTSASRSLVDSLGKYVEELQYSA